MSVFALIDQFERSRESSGATRSEMQSSVLSEQTLLSLQEVKAGSLARSALITNMFVRANVFSAPVISKSYG